MAFPEKMLGVTVDLSRLVVLIGVGLYFTVVILRNGLLVVKV